MADKTQKLEKPYPWKPKELYDFLNGKYFRGKLPDIPVHWSTVHYRGSRNNKFMGSTWFDHETGLPKKITLNPKFKTAFALWASTLIHECVHVEQYELPASQAHGRKFEKRIRELVARGAYRGLL